ncbi:MAG: hypothetical protein HOA57_01750 [Candidatus Magasanikbacteria bacterium]|jgi:riboflavin kinase / FMN adenylyltransferase|nr:hypothetical protein [Candidatus Magasanikbacteria bacterium]MBT4314723.1 hypothetical protein [Candidatus Magasanikbacteria bacterium]MBT4547500.1 hypothetical protein [Candidatus Magasanikbacteria bacterium]MBT6819078.1 hypothetical protein [Candidatus Magasanikbacteria bacterium]
MYSGKVIHGNGYGRQLGYPTANLDIKKEDIDLPSGVYVSKAVLSGNSFLASLTILESPVFKFEVHLLDYAGEDFYGEVLEVEIGERISDLIEFKDEEELKTKIKEDLQKIKNL